MVSVGCVQTKDSNNSPRSSSRDNLHRLPFVVAAFSLVDEILANFSSFRIPFHAAEVLDAPSSKLVRTELLVGMWRRAVKE